jgi:AraC family transcriptional regulator
MAGHSIRYLAGVRDEIINQVGHSIVSEMTNESAAGRMFVETASLMLAAHLLRTYGDSSSCKSFESTAHRLDHARLRRVLDHISVHLADEITVAELAGVAGLSTFHFARMFALAVGISPNRYVSRLRLEQAMADAAAGKLSLAQIAFKSGFSSQASFTRAFRRATGITPGEYRSYRRWCGWKADTASRTARQMTGALAHFGSAMVMGKASDRRIEMFSAEAG